MREEANRHEACRGRDRHPTGKGLPLDGVEVRSGRGTMRRTLWAIVTFSGDHMPQIKTCYLRDYEGCDSESCIHCEYHRLAVENAQLKAEIAALAQSAANSPAERPPNHHPEWTGYEQRTYAFFKSEKGEHP